MSHSLEVKSGGTLFLQVCLCVWTYAVHHFSLFCNMDLRVLREDATPVQQEFHGYFERSTPSPRLNDRFFKVIPIHSFDLLGFQSYVFAGKTRKRKTRVYTQHAATCCNMLCAFSSSSISTCTNYWFKTSQCLYMISMQRKMDEREKESRRKVNEGDASRTTKRRKRDSSVRNSLNGL